MWLRFFFLFNYPSSFTFLFNNMSQEGVDDAVEANLKFLFAMTLKDKFT